MVRSGCPPFHEFSGLNGGIDGYEKKDEVAAAYQLITAHWWGLQSHGNEWNESFWPGNVKHRTLLKRLIQKFNSGAAILKQKKPSLKDLEREAAMAYATAVCGGLKENQSNLYEKAAAVAFTSDLMPSTPHEWSDNPLPPESPLRVLAVLEMASWGKSFVSDSTDWGKIINSISQADMKKLTKLAEDLIKKHPKYAALVAVAIGGAFVIAKGMQNLYAVGGALAAIHLSELGINKQAQGTQDA